MASKKCEYINFSCLNDIVPIQLPEELGEIAYVANATHIRCALMKEFSRDDMNSV